MKKLLLFFGSFLYLSLMGQTNFIDFGTANSIFECNPIVFTTSGQIQCTDSSSILIPTGKALLYYTTDAGPFGQDCRNWFRLTNPGFSSIGTQSELQFRGATGGNTFTTPARFVIRDFNPGLRFAIQFDVLLAGSGGEFLFRCGTGKNYGDTVYIPDRDSFSFMVLKFDDNNPAISQPRIRYSQSLSNSSWPVSGPYNWANGMSSVFSRYQKHTIAIYCNNTTSSATYNYIYPKTLNPRSYDVYIDSVIDVDNRLDTFFRHQKTINSFMFTRSNAVCSNSGPYRGDTLILDNILWTNDFVNYILPIELTFFDCHFEERGVKLNWQTASELNNSHFEVERSSDGIQFEKIATIVGAGNSSTMKTYNYIDSEFLLEKSVYYRLRQVDFDGRSTMSDICLVKIPESNKTLIQNPLVGDILELNSPVQNAFIYNSIAMKVKSFSGTELYVRDLPAGIYVLIVGTKSYKFVKR